MMSSNNALEDEEEYDVCSIRIHSLAESTVCHAWFIHECKYGVNCESDDEDSAPPIDDDDDDAATANVIAVGVSTSHEEEVVVEVEAVESSRTSRSASMPTTTLLPV